MLNNDFLEKGLGIVCPTHFVYDFFKKNVSHIMTKFHFDLPLLIEILGNMCTGVVC